MLLLFLTCRSRVTSMFVFQPENILMADQKSNHIRICDFGNALKVKPNEELYCKYGTPEFIAPEIVNQSPISKSTDIW